MNEIMRDTGGEPGRDAAIQAEGDRIQAERRALELVARREKDK